MSLMLVPDLFPQAVRRRQFAVLCERNDEAFLQRIGKGWRILCDLQVQRVRVGSGTRLVQRPTKAPNRMAKIIGIIVNDLKLWWPW